MFLPKINIQGVTKAGKVSNRQTNSIFGGEFLEHFADALTSNSKTNFGGKSSTDGGGFKAIFGNLFDNVKNLSTSDLLIQGPISKPIPNSSIQNNSFSKIAIPDKLINLIQDSQVQLDTSQLAHSGIDLTRRIQFSEHESGLNNLQIDIPSREDTRLIQASAFPIKSVFDNKLSNEQMLSPISDSSENIIYDNKHAGLNEVTINQESSLVISSPDDAYDPVSSYVPISKTDQYPKKSLQNIKQKMSGYKREIEIGPKRNNQPLQSFASAKGQSPIEQNDLPNSIDNITTESIEHTNVIIPGPRKFRANFTDEGFSAKKDQIGSKNENENISNYHIDNEKLKVSSNNKPVHTQGFGSAGIERQISKDSSISNLNNARFESLEAIDEKVSSSIQMGVSQLSSLKSGISKGSSSTTQGISSDDINIDSRMDIAQSPDKNDSVQSEVSSLSVKADIGEYSSKTDTIPLGLKSDSRVSIQAVDTINMRQNISSHNLSSDSNLSESISQIHNSPLVQSKNSNLNPVLTPQDLILQKPLTSNADLPTSTISNTTSQTDTLNMGSKTDRAEFLSKTNTVISELNTDLHVNPESGDIAPGKLNTLKENSQSALNSRTLVSHTTSKPAENIDYFDPQTGLTTEFKSSSTIEINQDPEALIKDNLDYQGAEVRTKESAQGLTVDQKESEDSNIKSAGLQRQKPAGKNDNPNNKSIHDYSKDANNTKLTDRINSTPIKSNQSVDIQEPANFETTNKIKHTHFDEPRQTMPGISHRNIATNEILINNNRNRKPVEFSLKGVVTDENVSIIPNSAGQDFNDVKINLADDNRHAEFSPSISSVNTTNSSNKDLAEPNRQYSVQQTPDVIADNNLGISNQAQEVNFNADSNQSNIKITEKSLENHPENNPNDTRKTIDSGNNPIYKEFTDNPVTDRSSESDHLQANSSEMKSVISADFSEIKQAVKSESQSSKFARSNGDNEISNINNVPKSSGQQLDVSTNAKPSSSILGDISETGQQIKSTENNSTNTDISSDKSRSISNSDTVNEDLIVNIGSPNDNIFVSKVEIENNQIAVNKDGNNSSFIKPKAQSSVEQSDTKVSYDNEMLFQQEAKTQPLTDTTADNYYPENNDLSQSVEMQADNTDKSLIEIKQEPVNPSIQIDEQIAIDSQIEIPYEIESSGNKSPDVPESSFQTEIQSTDDRYLKDSVPDNTIKSSQGRVIENKSSENFSNKNIDLPGSMQSQSMQESSDQNSIVRDVINVAQSDIESVNVGKNISSYSNQSRGKNQANSNANTIVNKGLNSENTGISNTEQASKTNDEYLLNPNNQSDYIESSPNRVISSRTESPTSDQIIDSIVADSEVLSFSEEADNISIDKIFNRPSDSIKQSSQQISKNNTRNPISNYGQDSQIDDTLFTVGTQEFAKQAEVTKVHNGTIEITNKIKPDKSSTEIVSKHSFGMNDKIEKSSIPDVKVSLNSRDVSKAKPQSNDDINKRPGDIHSKSSSTITTQTPPNGASKPNESLAESQINIYKGNQHKLAEDKKSRISQGIDDAQGNGNADIISKSANSSEDIASRKTDNETNNNSEKLLTDNLTENPVQSYIASVKNELPNTGNNTPEIIFTEDNSQEFSDDLNRNALNQSISSESSAISEGHAKSDKSSYTNQVQTNQHPAKTESIIEANSEIVAKAISSNKGKESSSSELYKTEKQPVDQNISNKAEKSSVSDLQKSEINEPMSLKEKIFNANNNEVVSNRKILSENNEANQGNIQRKSGIDLKHSDHIPSEIEETAKSNSDEEMTSPKQILQPKKQYIEVANEGDFAAKSTMNEQGQTNQEKLLINMKSNPISAKADVVENESIAAEIITPAPNVELSERPVEYAAKQSNGHDRSFDSKSPKDANADIIPKSDKSIQTVGQESTREISQSIPMERSNIDDKPRIITEQKTDHPIQKQSDASIIQDDNRIILNMNEKSFEGDHIQNILESNDLSNQEVIVENKRTLNQLSKVLSSKVRDNQDAMGSDSIQSGRVNNSAISSEDYTEAVENVSSNSIGVSDDAHDPASNLTENIENDTTSKIWKNSESKPVITSKGDILTNIDSEAINLTNHPTADAIANIDSNSGHDINGQLESPQPDDSTNIIINNNTESEKPLSSLQDNQSSIAVESPIAETSREIGTVKMEAPISNETSSNSIIYANTDLNDSIANSLDNQINNEVESLIAEDPDKIDVENKDQTIPIKIPDAKSDKAYLAGTLQNTSNGNSPKSKPDETRLVDLTDSNQLQKVDNFIHEMSDTGIEISSEALGKEPPKGTMNFERSNETTSKMTTNRSEIQEGSIDQPVAELKPEEQLIDFAKNTAKESTDSNWKIDSDEANRSQAEPMGNPLGAKSKGHANTSQLDQNLIAKPSIEKTPVSTKSINQPAQKFTEENALKSGSFASSESHETVKADTIWVDGRENQIEIELSQKRKNNQVSSREFLTEKQVRSSQSANVEYENSTIDMLDGAELKFSESPNNSVLEQSIGQSKSDDTYDPESSYGHKEKTDAYPKKSSQNISPKMSGNRREVETGFASLEKNAKQSNTLLETHTQYSSEKQGNDSSKTQQSNNRITSSNPSNIESNIRPDSVKSEVLKSELKVESSISSTGSGHDETDKTSLLNNRDANASKLKQPNDISMDKPTVNSPLSFTDEPMVIKTSASSTKEESISNSMPLANNIQRISEREISADYQAGKTVIEDTNASHIELPIDNQVESREINISSGESKAEEVITVQSDNNGQIVDNTPTESVSETPSSEKFVQSNNSLNSVQTMPVIETPDISSGSNDAVPVDRQIVNDLNSNISDDVYDPASSYGHIAKSKSVTDISISTKEFIKIKSYRRGNGKQSNPGAVGESIKNENISYSKTDEAMKPGINVELGTEVEVAAKTSDIQMVRNDQTGVIKNTSSATDVKSDAQHFTTITEKFESNIDTKTQPKMRFDEQSVSSIKVETDSVQTIEVPAQEALSKDYSEAPKGQSIKLGSSNMKQASRNMSLKNINDADNTLISKMSIDRHENIIGEQVQPSDNGFTSDKTENLVVDGFAPIKRELEKPEKVIEFEQRNVQSKKITEFIVETERPIKISETEVNIHNSRPLSNADKSDTKTETYSNPFSRFRNDDQVRIIGKQNLESPSDVRRSEDRAIQVFDKENRLENTIEDNFERNMNKIDKNLNSGLFSADIQNEDDRSHFIKRPVSGKKIKDFRMNQYLTDIYESPQVSVNQSGAIDFKESVIVKDDQGHSIYDSLAESPQSEPNASRHNYVIENALQEILTQYESNIQTPSVQRTDDGLIFVDNKPEVENLMKNPSPFITLSNTGDYSIQRKTFEELASGKLHLKQSGKSAEMSEISAMAYSENRRNENPSRAITNSISNREVKFTEGEMTNRKTDSNSMLSQFKSEFMPNTPGIFSDRADVISFKSANTVNESAQATTYHDGTRMPGQNNFANAEGFDSKTEVSIVEDRRIKTKDMGNVHYKDDSLQAFLQSKNPAGLEKPRQNAAIRILDMTAQWLSNQRDFKGQMTVSDSVLGDVGVQFRANDAEIRVKIEVENDEAKAAMGAKLNSFIKGMKDQGFDEITVDIQTQNQGQQESLNGEGKSHTENGNNGHGSRNNNSYRSNSDEPENGSMGIYGLGNLRNQNNTLQIVA